MSSSSKPSIPLKLDNYKNELAFVKEELLKMHPQKRKELTESLLAISKAAKKTLK